MREKTKEEIEESKKVSIFLILSMIEVIYFVVLTYMISFNENKDMLNNLIELGFCFDKTNTYTLYAVSLIFILFLNGILIEEEFLKKYIDKIILGSFLILTCLSVQFKDLKLQEEKDFIATTKQPIERKVYREIEEELNNLKRNIEQINNDSLKEQYQKTIKIMNNVNYPITEIEYKTFLKEKENCYKIYNEIDIPKEYEIIKNFK